MKSLVAPFAFFAVLSFLSGKPNKSNSSGPDSPIVVGEVIAVSKDGNMVTLLQSGKYKREITIGKKTKLSFVGMPKVDRKPTIGYSGKASLKSGTTKYLKLTQPLPEAQSLGKGRASLTVAQVLTKADDDKDGGISYVEMSRWIYNSGKHGPDHFEKADQSKDGLLDASELALLLPKVNWWKYSRQPASAWFAQSDSNQDGVLGTIEFKVINGGDGHLEQRFKRADKDKDQTLSKEETAAYIQGLINK